MMKQTIHKKETKKTPLKQTKIERIKVLCEENKSIFSCPICRGAIVQTIQGDLTCENKHCFNIARKGYINFMNAAHESFYDKELFYSRSQIFQRGFYQPVAEAVEKVIASYATLWEKGAFNVLDIGCGEGYYLDWIATHFPSAHCFGIDLSKEAVKAATHHEADTIWAIADLTKLPFRSKTFHVLLNILTPANYEEFSRIQKKQGIVIKISPGKDYLKEIRNRFSYKNYNETRVMDYSKENMEILEENRIYYKKTLTETDWKDFLYMTPLTAHKQEERVRQIEFPEKEITIDLNLIVGRLKGRKR
ncbi:methyltransferase domain-containing protein [Sinanaerobacter sp. ZZT-01]|uniref:methyltransferase domain-containing protein n=1 Tax=Sinanaerobacter sp. ZZT-01 TaxID=3111540 RepID=UPI002D79D6B2|nr:methyltransferase domain-containing protein [Sinanaerobacter sp. ZZT-01]WRR92592.1 methyltransferase domain-containing protein [Sinanaerobacter sp. ZZT-01]